MRASGTVLTLLLAACGASAAEQSESDSYFPIWGYEARARGYSIPLPYGVNLSYMNIRQDIMVDSITFSGLKLGNHPIPSDMFAIDAGHTREKSKTENLRLDMWVFPFLNVYGLVGHTRGSSVSQVSVDSDPSQFRGLDRVISGAVHQLYQSGKLQNIDFTLDFKGTTWGTGFTLAGGYGNWFGLVDTNYTRTDFDILDGSISAVTVSPRVGYRFSFQGIDGPSHLSLWVGSMYQDVQQEFKGDLADLHMPP
ncbi:hypothetical protein, partial [Klebsiella pneumoniae]|uniref:hypothetical protein n=1 Tax=Klebsiella pneumoniae TaxID=573 RepID=UPI00103399DB